MPDFSSMKDATLRSIVADKLASLAWRIAAQDELRVRRMRGLI